MQTRIRIASLIAAVMVFLAAGQTAQAQQSGGFFTERFANVFDPGSRTYFSLQGTQGNQFGGQQPFTSFGASHHIGSIDDAITLFNGQLMANNNGNPAGTFGAQQRWLIDVDPLDNAILGAGIYFDFNQSRYDNLFQQVNLNFEFLTESSWVFRANGYLPIGQTQRQTGIHSATQDPAGQLSLIGTQVGIGGIDRQLMDVALMGSDFEFGRKFFDYRMEVYGGYYNWNGPLIGFTNGVKGGVRGYLTNNLSGNVNVSHDDFFGTNVYGGMTYFFGGSGGSRPMSFRNLMTLPAQRTTGLDRELRAYRKHLPAGVRCHNGGSDPPLLRRGIGHGSWRAVRTVQHHFRSGRPAVRRRQHHGAAGRQREPHHTDRPDPEWTAGDRRRIHRDRRRRLLRRAG